ncbi:MAG TPA: hypothetical protein PKZ08_14600 [Vicinamibacterales bacterium]|nr:hypothetical protein [Vicinamibacterales bacterium]
MLTVKPCNTYHAVLSGKALCRRADARSAFKVYFIDIIGRKDPARTVWAQSGLDRADFLARLAGTEGVEGVGFVTAFPHITKVFRHGPEAEVVMNVRAWNTRDLAPLSLGRGQDYVEFACLAETLIAADEHLFWADARTVEEYLARWSPFADGPVARHDKLLEYWTRERA